MKVVVLTALLLLISLRTQTDIFCYYSLAAPSSLVLQLQSWRPAFYDAPLSRVQVACSLSVNCLQKYWVGKY
jgi:hypothetical protein